MRAAVLRRPRPAGEGPLEIVDLPAPSPGPGEVLLRVQACAVCRTDLQLCEGDLDPRMLPIVPGHQIVGIVEEVGPDVVDPRPGERVGVAWIASTCGTCRFCRSGREPLRRVGVHRLVPRRGRGVHPFDHRAAAGLDLGAVWAGGYDEWPPEPLDAAITFAPVGSVVVDALKALDKGGVVAINAIHLDHVPGFDYEHLWWERQIRSVASVARADVADLVELAASIPIRTMTEVFALEDVNAPDSGPDTSATVPTP